MSEFIFEEYGYDAESKTATFRYSYDNERFFQESYQFHHADQAYNADALDRALRLAYILVGTSYYKTFAAKTALIKGTEIDKWQADFLNSVYQEGLSQFAYENNLTRDDLVTFGPTGESQQSVSYGGSGVISLQSGGKDSLLTAAMLREKGTAFSSLYVSSSPVYPAFIDGIGESLFLIERTIDREALMQATTDGALSGHIPITYIIMSIALVQAVLTNKKTVLTSIGHEGEEPHARVGDLDITHQWSKTWGAEQKFSEYVKRYVSSDLEIGSPLRQLSELRIADLFAQKVWHEYGHLFSSCNRINYKQGTDNSTLKWCGECPKCANSYLLFVPFVEPDELKRLFNGQDLFEKPLLENTFKGLLGIDGIEKPFECIGEVDELRYAYYTRKEGYASLPFDVPESHFDYKQTYPHQEWVDNYI